MSLELLLGGAQCNTLVCHNASVSSRRMNISLRTSGVVGITSGSTSDSVLVIPGNQRCVQIDGWDVCSRHHRHCSFVENLYRRIVRHIVGVVRRCGERKQQLGLER